MTFEEFNAKEEALDDKLVKEWDKDVVAELTKLQYDFMEQVLKDYEKTINGDPAKQVCYDLLYYAVHDSVSGNAIVDADFVTNEDEAKELQDTIFAEIGKYLLDDCEVYKSLFGNWIADAMFGGAFVPEWDGLEDYIEFLREREEIKNEEN